MFSHCTLGINDVATGKRFYDSIFREINNEEGKIIGKSLGLLYQNDGVPFILLKPVNREKATVGNGVTIGLSFDSIQKLERAFQNGLNNNGKSCEDPPGWRENILGKYYAAYIRDPDGNKLCLFYKS